MISVVIPVYNEEQNLPPLMDRLETALAGLEGGEPYEIILTDDGSADRSLEIMKGFAAARPGVRVVELVRNYGQHAAVFAGLAQARGEIVVTLDADLQNPPEEIPKIVAAFREGYDLVNTIREGRQDTFFRRYASRLTNAMVRKFSGITLSDFGCMLRGYHRNVVAPMVERKEYRTFIPALAMLHARRPTEVPVQHSARERGASNYSLLKLFSLQLDLVTSFSMAPLRMLIILGWGVALLGIGFGALLMVLRFVFGAEWAANGVFTLFAILFFFVGAQFLAFGLLGEYIGRIYQEVRNRPTYLLRDEEPGDRTGER